MDGGGRRSSEKESACSKSQEQDQGHEEWLDNCRSETRMKQSIPLRESVIGHGPGQVPGTQQGMWNKRAHKEERRWYGWALLFVHLKS